MHKTMHGYIFKACCGWDTLAMSGALARWNWGCHNAESHLGRGRASKMRAVFDSWEHSQKHFTAITRYLWLSLRYVSWRIDVQKMRLAGQLPLLLCSNIKTLCINALKQSRTLLRMWLKIFCQAWHLFHGAHSHCKAVKLSCCLRPWHTFSSLRKYTRVMLQATHSNSVVPLLEAKAALCWATSHQTLQIRRPNCFSGKADPCMILYDPHASLDFESSPIRTELGAHVGLRWAKVDFHVFHVFPFFLCWFLCCRQRTQRTQRAMP